MRHCYWPQPEKTNEPDKVRLENLLMMKNFVPVALDWVQESEMCVTLGDTSIQLFLHWYIRPVDQASLHPNRKEMKENSSRLLTWKPNGSDSGSWATMAQMNKPWWISTNEYTLVNKYKCTYSIRGLSLTFLNSSLDTFTWRVSS